jgi:hypothetical protein
VRWCHERGRRDPTASAAKERTDRAKITGGIFRAIRAVAIRPSPRSVFGRTRLSWPWRTRLGRPDLVVRRGAQPPFATARMTRQRSPQQCDLCGHLHQDCFGVTGHSRAIDTPTSPQEHSGRQEAWGCTCELHIVPTVECARSCRKDHLISEAICAGYDDEVISAGSLAGHLVGPLWSFRTDSTLTWKLIRVLEGGA